VREDVLRRATSPKLGQVSNCGVCEELAAYTNKVKTTQSGGGPVMVTEVMYCNVCRTETILATPRRTWPNGGKVVSYTQIGSMVSRQVWPPKIAAVGPPQILCSSCGEVLEKADDCYRCKCGREVRP
jgi:hypothetical protein